MKNTLLRILSEGRSEERFAKTVLTPHLSSTGIHIVEVRSVKTSEDSFREYRGGLNKYEHVKRDLQNWMKDKPYDAYFTTMFDLYDLPSTFPGFLQAQGILDPYVKVTFLEQEFFKDIADERLIPYIQLHEIEALIFTDAQKLDWEFLEHDKEIENLIDQAKSVGNPELINDHPNTAPSKRIIQQIPAFKNRKATVVPSVLEKIGLQNLRTACRHFHEWLDKLESL